MYFKSFISMNILKWETYVKLGLAGRWDMVKKRRHMKVRLFECDVTIIQVVTE